MASDIAAAPLVLTAGVGPAGLLLSRISGRSRAADSGSCPSSSEGSKAMAAKIQLLIALDSHPTSSGVPWVVA